MMSRDEFLAALRQEIEQLQAAGKRPMGFTYAISAILHLLQEKGVFSEDDREFVREVWDLVDGLRDADGPSS